MKRIKVAQFGLGWIGTETLKLAAQQPWLEVVGTVDFAPDLVGRPLTELTGLGQLDGLKVVPDLDALFRETPPELILHTASSSVAATLAQMRPALEFGVSVVSSCEQLVFPALKEPALAKEYDALCRHTGARITAAGAQLGFVMDVLPIMLTGANRRVDGVVVERVVDASTERRSWQTKIGVVQSREAFQGMLQSGRVGHAGLSESAALVAHAMGWTLDSLTEIVEPVLATRDITTGIVTVPAGSVCGVHQRAVGVSEGRERVVLDFTCTLDARDARNRVEVRGHPSLDLALKTEGGSDDAAVASLINTVPRLMSAAPGVRLATELSLPKWAMNS